MNYYYIFLAQIVPILVLIYFYFQRKFSYWSKRGITGPKPSIPFGNFMAFMRDDPKRVDIKWEKEHGQIFGIYNSTVPVLMISDTELIKQVLIKDFHVFVNRMVIQFDHEIYKHNLFTSEDDQWKRIRAITSPTFSTGKLRGMHKLMGKCVDMLCDYFDQIIDTTDGNINAKEIITGFTIDVIASTSFATKTNCNVDGNKSIFRKNGIALTSGSSWRMLAFMALPKKINKWLGNSVSVGDKVFNFFIDLSREIIRQRKKDGAKVKRTDLVQLMMDAFVYEDELKDASYDKLTATADNESNSATQTHSTDSIKRTLTEPEIIAQCIIFFLAGFETTATTLSNVLKHISQNLDIQKRLSEELDEALDGLDENSEKYYDTVINKIPYLESVIKETLRLDSPVFRLQRRVGVDGYKLAGIPLEKDTEVNISPYVIHYNPENYPEPEKFNPDRFMPENKHLLVPYTYIPFGAGPRNCIGMRFAYQEMKLCLAKIFRQFKFEPQPPKTESKFKFLHSFFLKNVPVRISKR